MPNKLYYVAARRHKDDTRDARELQSFFDAWLAHRKPTPNEEDHGGEDA